MFVFIFETRNNFWGFFLRPVLTGFCRSCLCISMKMWLLCWTSRLVLVVIHTLAQLMLHLFCSFQPGVVRTWTKSAVQCTDGKRGKRRGTKKNKNKKRTEHRHVQKLKRDVRGEKCTASGGSGTLISLLRILSVSPNSNTEDKINSVDLKATAGTFCSVAPCQESTSWVKEDLEFCPVSSFPFGSPPIT